MFTLDSVNGLVELGQSNGGKLHMTAGDISNKSALPSQEGFKAVRGYCEKDETPQPATTTTQPGAETPKRRG